MKFITFNEKFEIQLIHNMPFDEINGLGKTEEELLQIGALVDSIPVVEVPNDKNIIYKYNKVDNTVTYELVDKPLTIEEQNAKSIENIQQVNSGQDDLIDIALLATDEMYMMIEPLLAAQPQTINGKGVSKMVDMYVAMVIRGLKTIDEVPARYREQVKEILAKLEK